MLLRAAALWTVFIWGTRIANILGDDHRSFGFKAVHTVLALVSIVFALAIWTVASRNRRDESDRGERRRAREGRVEN
jgi:hypothetical protein